MCFWWIPNQWDALQTNLFPSFFHHLKIFCHGPFSYDCFHARNYSSDNLNYFWFTQLLYVCGCNCECKEISSPLPLLHYYHYLWFDLTIVDRRTYIKYSDSFLPPVNILDNACQRQKKLEKFVMILQKRMLTIWLTSKLFFFSCMITNLCMNNYPFSNYLYLFSINEDH